MSSTKLCSNPQCAPGALSYENVENWKWPLVSLTLVISGSTWPNNKIKVRSVLKSSQQAYFKTDLTSLNQSNRTCENGQKQTGAPGLCHVFRVNLKSFGTSN